MNFKYTEPVYGYDRPLPAVTPPNTSIDTLFWLAAGVSPERVGGFDSTEIVVTDVFQRGIVEATNVGERNAEVRRRVIHNDSTLDSLVLNSENALAYYDFKNPDVSTWIFFVQRHRIKYESYLHDTGDATLSNRLFTETSSGQIPQFDSISEKVGAVYSLGSIISIDSTVPFSSVLHDYDTLELDVICRIPSVGELTPLIVYSSTGGYNGVLLTGAPALLLLRNGIYSRIPIDFHMNRKYHIKLIIKTDKLVALIEDGVEAPVTTELNVTKYIPGYLSPGDPIAFYFTFFGNSLVEQIVINGMN